MIHTLSHPGEILAETLDDMEITVTKAAKDLGVSRQILSGIPNGRRSITPEMAVRIGKYLGNGPDIWARMQTSYDLRQAETALRATLRGICEGCLKLAPSGTNRVNDDWYPIPRVASCLSFRASHIAQARVRPIVDEGVCGEFLVCRIGRKVKESRPDLTPGLKKARVIGFDGSADFQAIESSRHATDHSKTFNKINLHQFSGPTAQLA